ncbi:sensor domain-containing diguanylate cyclase [Thalassotalea euphylliae]|uniref:diguanylate cyclase n=1 Tax=Thalassotalea euphylliae TaxID=1655234 RepID=A0A3E0U4T1_9GAMM|nr:sensor domain-containing diguanylate cyclase [Thalassotalea euphylliae]REL31799.1 sensor domain-containing diguanylate cyclase [Thalassotalea euphylliae]
MSSIQQLIENSRTNEAIAKKLFEIETEILSCSSSKELLQTLLTLIKNKFQLHDIHLLLIDPPPLSYMLSQVAQTDWHTQHTRQISAERLALFHGDEKPLLTNQLAELDCILPTSLFEGAKSAAFIPVKLEGKLFGSLLLTDRSSGRFAPDLGTIHLEQLAVKVSLCLSNVLIREQLEYMANYDRLTGVANRRLMEVTITEELSRQKRYSTPFSLLFIDCNKFKQINDTYGHDCGDKVLVYVASQIKELIRDTDHCFRYAGDEFVITLANQRQHEADQVAQRLVSFFANHQMRYQDKLLPVTISCGAVQSNGKQTMDDLLKLADQAQYRHKATHPTHS